MESTEDISVGDTDVTDIAVSVDCTIEVTEEIVDRFVMEAMKVD